jgi:hypothetical protein
VEEKETATTIPAEFRTTRHENEAREKSMRVGKKKRKGHHLHYRV